MFSFFLLSLLITYDLWPAEDNLRVSLLYDHVIIELFPPALCSQSLGFTPSHILMHNQTEDVSFSGLPRPHQSPPKETYSQGRLNKRHLRKGNNRSLRNFLKDASSHLWHLLFRMSNCRWHSEFWYCLCPEPRSTQSIQPASKFLRLDK